MNYSKDEFLIHKKIISQKGFINIKIVSDSMVPLININENLKVSQITGMLKRFDIIIFWQNNKLICHYLWKIHQDPNYYFFKSLKYPQKTDKGVEENNLLGIVYQKKLSIFQKLKIFLIVLFNPTDI